VTTESLYPFRYAGVSDPVELLSDVARSTREKIEEIDRVPVFGNGGSSTDAPAVASLHVDPGPGRRALPVPA
jgi:D-sedoheptulose 7-phosphate isomerase